MKKSKQQPRKLSVKRKTTKPTKPVRRKQATTASPKETVAQPSTPTAVASIPPTQGKVRKKDTVIALLHREQGATLTDLTAATGWQAHSVIDIGPPVLSRKAGRNRQEGRRNDGFGPFYRDDKTR